MESSANAGDHAIVIGDSQGFLPLFYTEIIPQKPKKFNDFITFSCKKLEKMVKVK